MKHASPQIFFITGCQRTGNTLMRLILESHSKVSCVDETRAYSILSNQNLLDQELKSCKDKLWLGFKVPRIAEQLLEPFLADIGIDFRIQNMYKRKKTIFMIRNVFDTIVSMKTLDQEGKSWLEKWAKTTVDFWEKTNPEFKKQYSQDLEFLKNNTNKSIIAGAIYWKFKTNAYFKYLDNQIPIIQIKYEDLVTESKKTIHHILDFLDLAWEDSVLSHEKILHPETDERGITIGNNNTKMPITSSSVGKYTKHLAPDEISQISHIAKDLMFELNYKSEYVLPYKNEIN